MASPSRYEVEVTVSSARDLKNVSWRYGDLKPYAVVWVDPASKCSTKVDVEGDVNPVWDEKLRIPIPYDRRIDDSTLCIDVVHARSNDQDDTKPLIGSARLPLREVVDEAGISGAKVTRSLKLKRPSGRPHGKIEVAVAVKEPSRYYDPYAAPYAYAYGQPTGSSSSSRDYPAPVPAYGGQPPYGQPQYGSGYAQPYSAPLPAGYPYSAPPPPPAYGASAPAYGQGYGAPAPAPASVYGTDQGYGAPPTAAVQEQKKSKFGMGTGLAVGAVAGVLGGLALAEGVGYVEDKIEDRVAERVEDDLAYEDGGYDDDF